MRVVLELWQAADGRIDGVLATDGAPVRAFAGVLELLAALEDVLITSPA